MKCDFDIMQLINTFVSCDATRGVFNEQDCFILHFSLDEVPENDKRISWKKLETKLSQ